MNTSSLMRIGAVVLCAGLLGAIAPHVEAATRTSYSHYWQYSTEGSVSTTTLARGISRRGITSAAQKAIDALDSEPVQDLPIPVLLGVAVSDLYPNFGDPRDGGTRTHEGEDIMAPKDDYIVSPTDAVVTSVGTGESAGNYVYTANPGSETFAYMHLDKFAPGIKAGTILKKVTSSGTSAIREMRQEALHTCTSRYVTARLPPIPFRVSRPRSP